MVRWLVIFLSLAVLLVVGVTLTADVGPTQVSADKHPHEADSGCEVSVGKHAAPDRVIIGDEAAITLTIQADCQRLQAPIHAALVIDNSLDMGGVRMGHMREAVMAFADEIDLGVSQSEVGLVSYHGTVEILSPLTSDREALEAATQRFFPRPGSDLLTGMTTAASVLAADGTDDVLEVVLVLSGSLSENEPEELIAASQVLQDAGALVVTVAGSGNADVETLEAMASSPASHYIESQSSRYPSLFREIARDLTSVRLTGAEITDVLPANMTYAWGSGIPAPRVRDDTLAWSYAVWPTDGVTITYVVEPQDLGRHPTNVRAEAVLHFERGAPVSKTFPVPAVEVIAAPTSTAPPPTITPTPRPTEPPRPAYLPLAMNRMCGAKALPSRVAVLVDTSLSMYDRTAAGGVKLEYVQIAATDFVGALDLPLDRATIVVFGDDGKVTQPLTGERVALEIALGRVYGQVTRGSRLSDGLVAAAGELTKDTGRAGSDLVIVLVTDGVDDHDLALAVAAEVRKSSAIYAIGIGPDVDAALLSRLAGGAHRAFHSMDGSNLGDHYADVARLIACGAEVR
jgi:uncharacterized protein YegL